MKLSSKTFISSTFWSERSGFVAGIATLNEMKRTKSWKIISEKGRKIKKLLSIEAKKYDLIINFSGLDALIKFNILNSKIKNYEKIITSEMLKNNFLANNSVYVSVAHTDKLIKEYIKNMSKIFKLISHGK